MSDGGTKMDKHGEEGGVEAVEDEPGTEPEDDIDLEDTPDDLRSYVDEKLLGFDKSIKGLNRAMAGKLDSVLDEVRQIVAGSQPTGHQPASQVGDAIAGRLSAASRALLEANPGLADLVNEMTSDIRVQADEVAGFIKGQEEQATAMALGAVRDRLAEFIEKHPDLGDASDPADIAAFHKNVVARHFGTDIPYPDSLEDYLDLLEVKLAKSADADKVEEAAAIVEASKAGGPGKVTGAVRPGQTPSGEAVPSELDLDKPFDRYMKDQQRRKRGR